MSEKPRFDASNTKNPIASTELDRKFNSLGLPNLEETYDYLMQIGINPKFIIPLAKMFNKLSTSTTEILKQKSNIESANIKLGHLDKTGDRKIRLATMQAANDDIGLSKAA